MRAGEGLVPTNILLYNPLKEEEFGGRFVNKQQVNLNQ